MICQPAFVQTWPSNKRRTRRRQDEWCLRHRIPHEVQQPGHYLVRNDSASPKLTSNIPQCASCDDYVRMSVRQLHLNLSKVGRESSRCLCTECLQATPLFNEHPDFMPNVRRGNAALRKKLNLRLEGVSPSERFLNSHGPRFRINQQRTIKLIFIPKQQ